MVAQQLAFGQGLRKKKLLRAWFTCMQGTVPNIKLASSSTLYGFDPRALISPSAPMLSRWGDRSPKEENLLRVWRTIRNRFMVRSNKPRIDVPK